MNAAPTNYITRFAPSPTGKLHKGHAYSAMLAYQMAKRKNGRFVLRIEDIDTSRCRPEYTAGIYEDLHWLGLEWETPVRIQSNCFSDYTAALEKLREMGVVYPCFCTRKDILTEIASASNAPHGPEGPIYPGTCQRLGDMTKKMLFAEAKPHAWRLNLSAALKQFDTPLSWHDDIRGEVIARPEALGDVVLARKDTPTSYHLSVVVDDALQGITHIVRGEDLFHTTHIHVVLQRLLKLETPSYHHHHLLVDEEGLRFAKRNKSVTLQNIREAGVTAKELISSLGF